MLHGKVKKILPLDHLAAIIRLTAVFSRRVHGYVIFQNYLWPCPNDKK
jgi:hypothetical protein